MATKQERKQPETECPLKRLAHGDITAELQDAIVQVARAGLPCGNEGINRIERHNALTAARGALGLALRDMNNIIREARDVSAHPYPMSTPYDRSVLPDGDLKVSKDKAASDQICEALFNVLTTTQNAHRDATRHIDNPEENADHHISQLQYATEMIERIIERLLQPFIERNERGEYT